MLEKSHKRKNSLVGNKLLRMEAFFHSLGTFRWMLDNLARGLKFVILH